MKLAQLLTSARLQGPEMVYIPEAGVGQDREISGVSYDSRAVAQNGVFVAVPGCTVDGHDFIGQAVTRGAAAVVCQRPVSVGAETAVIQVADARRALAQLAAAFYGHPSQCLTVIGVTGTNGKTTTSFLIESVLRAAGWKTGVIGTVNCRYDGRVYDTPVTTPESLDLQRMLSDMHATGVSHVVMEVSSHALDLHRVHACKIDLGVFTNLTQDHLDYHHDMDSYWACKSKLFRAIVPAHSSRLALRAVINRRDPRGRELSETLQLPHLTTGSAADADVWASSADFTLRGVAAQVRTPQGAFDLHCPLVGHHNLENMLSAVGVGIALGVPLPQIAAGIAALERVPGRLERVPNPHERFVYVDYAHTPDALANVLKALRALTRDRIICVFGCGGDRDRGKRPQMGAIVDQLSDWAVVTSDNPRTESPEAIIADILAGIPDAARRRMTADQLQAKSGDRGLVVETDRRKAIALSIGASRPGDTILIAGKGHEPYQILGREKFPFDDRLEAHKALERLTGQMETR
jgi:UDP-N-acetylmuramyl-tripeptide synthetase